MDKLSSSVKNKKTTLKIKGALALWLLISSPPVPGEEGLPVAFITDLLAALGEHLPLLLVGCVEILLAVYLIGKLLWGKVQRKSSGKGRGAEAIFLQEWKRQSEEVCILLRRRDRMPVYTAGNLREVLGVTLTRLREDAASLLAGLDDETERKQRWKTYLDWDGAKPLVAEAAMQNGRWVRFIAHRSRNDNYDLIFGRDITREHQRLEDDKTKLMQVEEASQSKTTFLSRMSHEIRTPMNGIIGMLALAEGKMQKQDPAMQYLDKANELSAHLLSLINDILDMSRIEAGKVELENKPFSLRAMVDMLYDMFAKTLDARSICYAVIFEGVTVDWLLGDELRLSQIMINFLSNAVKFTEQGEIIVTIRSMLRSFKIRVFDEDTGYGLLRHVLVRRGFHSGEVMVVLVLGSPILPSKNNFVKALRKLHPEITTVVVNVNDKQTSMVLGEKETVIYGKGYIEDTLCGCTFRISPKSFYQVNPVQTEILYNKAITYAGLTGKEKVIDAYCGTGTIGLIAASQAKEVIGVELNRDAVKDAVINAKRNNIKNEQFYNADAGKFMVELAEQNEKVDVVFMDPPRSGSDEAFLSSVVKLAPKKVVFVSCNPETLARDLKYLTRHGYQAVECQPCDMFPFTKHVEAICLLSKKF